MMKNLLLILFLPIVVDSCAQKKENYEQLRNRMVDYQIASRGIKDKNTINAFRKVPRHLFVPESMIELAYNDSPLPIGIGQTISQPYIVALMTELSEPKSDSKVLEIGTGSGYQAAILAELTSHVYSIEIIPELAEQAERRLKALGYNNITIKCGDGYKGWPEFKPFDIIIVTAACNHIPNPLIQQLSENGRMVIPIGEPSEVQDLVLIEKRNGNITKRVIAKVRFVPFTRK